MDDEIERAFDKERRLMQKQGQKIRTLIALNLDDYLFSEDYTNPKKKQMHTRYAAPFVGWEHDNTIFEEQIEQVIAALRPDEGREMPPRQIAP